MYPPLEDLIPVQTVLNDPASPFFEVPWRDARSIIGPIVKRKPRYGMLRREFFRASDVEQAEKRIAAESDT